MPLPERFRSPGFWWTAAAASAVVLLAALPSLRPDWFVGPSGQVSVLGGVGTAALLAGGLMLGWRWVRYVALAFLTIGGALAILWAVTNGAPAYRPGHLFLAALALSAAAVLAFAQPVRSYFERGGAV